MQVQDALQECQRRIDNKTEELAPVWQAMDTQLQDKGKAGWAPGSAWGPEYSSVARRLEQLSGQDASQQGLVPKLALLEVPPPLRCCVGASGWAAAQQA